MQPIKNAKVTMNGKEFVSVYMRSMAYTAYPVPIKSTCRSSVPFGGMGSEPQAIEAEHCGVKMLPHLTVFLHLNIFLSMFTEKSISSDSNHYRPAMPFGKRNIYFRGSFQLQCCHSFKNITPLET